MKITLSTLRELRAYPHFKLGALCSSAGLNESTIRTKVKEGRELSESESERLSLAFGPFYSERDVKPLLEALRRISSVWEDSVDWDDMEPACDLATEALKAWEGVKS